MKQIIHGGLSFERLGQWLKFVSYCNEVLTMSVVEELRRSEYMCYYLMQIGHNCAIHQLHTSPNLSIVKCHPMLSE